jgi:hypothetical protein
MAGLGGLGLRVVLAMPGRGRVGGRVRWVGRRMPGRGRIGGGERRGEGRVEGVGGRGVALALEMARRVWKREMGRGEEMALSVVRRDGGRGVL